MNFFWLNNKKDSLTQQLSKLDHKTYDYAVDESELLNITDGIKPYPQYVTKRTQVGIPKYPIATDGKAYPLELLNKHQNQKDITIVLSVGAMT